jgi:hypothetical protein
MDELDLRASERAQMAVHATACRLASRFRK